MDLRTIISPLRFIYARLSDKMTNCFFPLFYLKYLPIDTTSKIKWYRPIGALPDQSVYRRPMVELIRRRSIVAKDIIG